MSADAGQARSLHFVRDEDLMLTQGGIHAATQAWCADWGIPATELKVQCREVQLADRDAAWARIGEKCQFWAETEVDLPSRLYQWLLGRAPAALPIPAADASVVGDLVRGAEQALLASLTGSLLHRLAPTGGGDAATAPPAAWFERFAGCVVTQVSVAGHCVVRLLTHLDARPVGPIGRSKGLAGLATALRDRPVRLSLVAGEMSVSVGDLDRVLVGDVFRLVARVDQPMRVSVERGTPVCSAFVGLQGGAPAMRLTTLEPNTDE